MNTAPAWLARVARTTRRAIRRGLAPRWVVAVSGGSDSVAMLRALHAIAPGLGLTISVAHLDHGARPEAADDARFVAGLAAALGLDFDLGHWRPERPAHFEADARRARLAWLAEVASRRGALAVAVGQTRDDQAETILHHLVRGTGPRGLAGMPRIRPLAGATWLVRPVLDARREALRDYLQSLAQPWRDDPSNADTGRTRARVRHDLLPRLAADYNPAVVEALARLGRLARASTVALDEYSQSMLNRVLIDRDDTRVVLDRGLLAGLASFLRSEVLRLAWRAAGWPEAAMDGPRWRRLAAWAVRPGTRRDVGAGVALRVEQGETVLDRRAATDREPSILPVRLDVPGTADWPGGRVVATLDPDDPRVERLDLDRLALPLQVAPPRPGDRFDPLGLDGRTTPLADFFRGRGVARLVRDRVPIVRDALGIVWVAGHRIGHRARLTAATQRVVGLHWEPTASGQQIGL